MTARMTAEQLRLNFEVTRSGRAIPRRATGGTTPHGDIGPAKPSPPVTHLGVPGPVPLPRWPLRRMMKPEEVLQRQIVAELRPELAARRIMIASIGAEIALGGDIGRQLQAAKKAMGGVPGMTDLIVIGPGPAGLMLEAKRASTARMQPVDGVLRVRQVGAGQLTSDQMTMRDFLRAIGWPWALVRSVKEARAAVARVWP